MEALGDALSGFVKGAATAGLASVLGIAASDSVLPRPDVHKHNAQVAAGHVLQSDDVSSKEAMDTAKPLKAYRKLQRTAMERGLKEALLGEGNEGDLSSEQFNLVRDRVRGTLTNPDHMKQADDLIKTSRAARKFAENLGASLTSSAEARLSSAIFGSGAKDKKRNKGK